MSIMAIIIKDIITIINYNLLNKTVASACSLLVASATRCHSIEYLILSVNSGRTT